MVFFRAQSIQCTQLPTHVHTNGWERGAQFFLLSTCSASKLNSSEVSLHILLVTPKFVHIEAFAIVMQLLCQRVSSNRSTYKVNLKYTITSLN